MTDNFVLNYISLGARIKQVRQERNMTQAELGEACSLSTSYIGHIERGSRTLSVETLFKIATVLNVSLDFLVSDSMSNYHSIFTTIDSQLKNQDKNKVATFTKIVKVLADNINNI